MTRDEALLKLVAIEPATEHQLVRETGWGATETQRVLEEMVRAGKLVRRRTNLGMRYCLHGQDVEEARPPRRAHHTRSARFTPRLIPAPWPPRMQ